MSKKAIDFFGDISDETKIKQKTAIRKYEEYHNQTMEKLIEEALFEQKNDVPYHELKVYERLLDFRNFLVKNDYSLNTITHYFTTIKTVYNKCRVEIPTLPSLNIKRAKKYDAIEFEQLLTKEEIVEAMYLMSPHQKARTMAMATGGLSNQECSVLTTRQFIDDLYCYHQENNDILALQFLANSDNIVWVTKIIRQKTKKPYYAVFNPETVSIIAQSKLKEKTLKPHLLPSNKIYFNQVCSRINDQLGFGSAGAYRRFRPHMLRKFHATAISGAVLDYEEQLEIREIDELQGRGKTPTQATYMKTNKLRQKLLYCKVMNNVSLFNQYDYDFVDGDVVVTRRNPFEEVRKTREENKKLKNDLLKSQEPSEKVNSLIQEIGFDNFKQGLSKLLEQY